jgi:hypothetical protein
MSEILKELSAPFHPSRITWKPQAMTKDKAKAMAAAYADLRAYQDRLDTVCGLDWSVSYTGWGDRIICHLTVSGITRSSTGESDAQAEKNDIAGTAAEAQAFKRACAMFGLGRYLYNLPTMWVEFDSEHGRFTANAMSRLNGIVSQHYQRYLDGRPEEPVKDAGTAEDADQSITAMLDELGKELYGNQWPTVRQKNFERVTGGAELTPAHVQKLIGGLQKLKAQRVGA